MAMLSHVHHLFSAEHCQAYIHTLRWKDRLLQCPRCQSQYVDPWRTYPYRPGCQRSWCNGCQRTFNDLTATLLHQSSQAIGILDPCHLSVVSRLFVPAHCQGSGHPCPDQLSLGLVAAQRRVVL